MMNVTIKILPNKNILDIIPIMMKYTDNKEKQSVLEARFLEMATQNYECVVVYDNDKIIGLAGLWFMTRHYSGKSVEPDHIYILEEFQSKGLGAQLIDWIHKYAKNKGCNTSELNTYVQNYPSHKFYYNHGYEIFGYHFYKTL